MAVRILDEQVANKIAAGEVVERPASVVKELVENSLDAGARHIEIDLEHAGRALLRVTDDGCGMDRQDALLALQRFATSKIETADDLNAIQTLGFRGEALPSIAAVSDLKLITRQPDAAEGVELTVVAGTVTDLREVGAPPGTQVAVHRLFYNTPARLKFLRSDTTELSHVVDLVNRVGFAHPHLHLRLTNDGREVAARPGTGDLAQSVATLVGREAFRHLVPLDLTVGPVHVGGFVSKPDYTRASRSQQTFIINRRWVRSRLLGHALQEAYHTLLPPGRHPLAIIVIDLDPTLVDVNVHPTKSEVRFTREWEVHQAVARAIKEALGGVSLAREGAIGAARDARRPAADQPSLAMAGQPGALPSMQARLPVSDQPEPRPVGVGTRSLTPLGQLRDTYLLADGGDGLVLVDQHRAHERVLYERLSRAQAEGKIDRQRLVIPATLHLSPAESAALEDNLPAICNLGFEIETFGGRTFVMRAVPALLARRDGEAVIRDMIEELASQPTAPRLDQHADRLLALMACKGAIKAGQRLGAAEITQLLADLLATDRPYTCPHGAPVVMTISNYELDKKFHR
jgi:DNA mismatch repair protein MutL